MAEPTANEWISESPFWPLVTTLPASLLFGLWYFWGISYFSYGVLNRFMDLEAIAAWLTFSLIATFWSFIIGGIALIFYGIPVSKKLEKLGMPKFAAVVLTGTAPSLIFFPTYWESGLLVLYYSSFMAFGYYAAERRS